MGTIVVHFEFNLRGERREQNANLANAIIGMEISLGGERGEQHANQANVIRYFETSQGGEREEQHTNHANVVKDVKISFGFKREEQLTNQANFMTTKSKYQLTLNDLYKKYVMKKSKFLSSDNNSEIFAVNIDNQSI